MSDAPTSPTRLLLLGLIFHLIYIFSVFDCYFRSPVVNGMQRFRMPEPAPAKRLVLIVGDGLRADVLFNLNPFPQFPDSPEVSAPYLREIAEKRGAFGVSHTRVPTESRPGHVAIIGGMYEDVSAIAKGWKTNPVDFDSVFNQSSTTYSFGSPDILPMFEHGAVPGRVKTWMYDEDEEDFTKDATVLDTWVLEQLKVLFDNSTRDDKLDREMRGENVVFFLHLLGLDTTGHSYRPHSKEYRDNIQVVDEIVRETEALFRDFYDDDKTAFIFTADHGMSNIGNHGDGHPDNTRTPLIAWGAGIRGPLPDPSNTTHDEFSLPWGTPLTSLYRQDVHQADIAPLMSALIGQDWPANSVGVLPDVGGVGYLDFGEENERRKAEGAFVNAKVILEHYRVKNTQKADHTVPQLYKPFPELSDFDAIEPGKSTVAHIEGLLAAQKWTEAREESAELIDTSLRGLRYLQTYDWLFLRFVVTAGYLGWSVMCALILLRVSAFPNAARFPPELPSSMATLTFLGCAGLFIYQRSPYTYWLYVVFPIYFWRNVLIDLPILENVWKTMTTGASSFDAVISVVVRISLVVTAVERMVVGYVDRSIWTYGFFVMGALWPMSNKSSFIDKNTTLVGVWAVMCLLSSWFPTLSVEKSEDLTMVLLGGAASAVVGLAALYYLESTAAPQTRSKNVVAWSLRSVVLIEVFFILLSMYSTQGAVRSLQARQGLPFKFQIIGWISLIVSALVPYSLPCSDHRPSSRLLIYFLAFCPAFVILSISWEGLFYVGYAVTLYVWIEMEAKVSSLQPAQKASREGVRMLRVDDVRIAIFYLFFVHIAFFGTGNVASMSNFYLEPVYRLVPVFKPFLMAVLLLHRVFLPYTLFSAVLATLNKRLHLPPFSIFLVAAPLTDMMTMMMFYRVRDEGSWLEIGQTLSHFVITSLLSVWCAGISVVGERLMAGTVDVDALEEKKDGNGKQLKVE